MLRRREILRCLCSRDIVPEMQCRCHAYRACARNDPRSSHPRRIPRSLGARGAVVEKPDLEVVWEHYGGRVLGSPGGWQKAICCVHEDSTPSASVNLDEQKWSCFVCQEGGDSLDLIQLKENVGFKEAIEHARIVGFEQGEARPAQQAGGSLSKPARHVGNRVPSGKGNHRGGLFRPSFRQGDSSLTR